MNDLTIFLIINQADVDEFNKIYFEKHPRAKIPPIKAPQHPSINEYTIMNNQAANKLKQNWKDFINWILQKHELIGLNIKRCKITYRTYFRTAHRHDADNVSPKYIFDAFVDSKFIIDDDLDHIVSLTIEGGIDKKNPRMEFIVDVIE